MNAELERQVEGLFHELADLPPVDRERALKERAAVVPELRQRIERLLILHDSSCDPGLRTPAFGLPLDRTSLGTPPLPKRIGRYEIVRLVGEGGMSTVYEAIQERPHRTVAVKVVRHTMTSETMLRRLQFEAEVLGQLQHSAIAQIYEAGMAEFEVAGGMIQQPFLAMEYVAGRSITAYAAGRNLGVGERLELLARVCDAVQYAHHKGVIHRDLKPANIMVRESYDMPTVGGSAASPGQPVVLDFGIALVLVADLAALRLKTGEGQILGTLAYMSPEQVRGDPAHVDTRSDVYALGVILYELLAGRLPHEVAGMPILQAMNQICEAEPIHIRAIAPGLGREIEAICAKALHRDKTHRYQSAADLAADIRRFLRKEPIEARSDSTLYVLSKNVQRYRAPIAAALLLVVLLAAFAVYAAVQAKHFSRVAQSEQEARQVAQAANVRADQQRQLAEQLAARSSQSLVLVEKILAVPEPKEERTEGFEASFRQHIDDFSGALGEFEDPEVEMVVRRAIARAYLSMGDPVAAIPHLERALELARGISKPEEVVSALRELAGQYNEIGRPQQAETLLREAVALWEIDPTAQPGSLARVLRSLGLSLLNQKRYLEGRDAYLQAIELYRKSEDEHSPNVAFCERRVVRACLRLGEPEAAERFARESLERARADLGPLHEAVANRLGRLATFYQDVGRDAEAEPLLREVVDIRKAIGESTDRIAAGTASIGINLLRQGRVAEAEEPLREALANPPGKVEFGDLEGVSRESLAEVLRKLGRPSESEALLREALERDRRQWGPEHPYVGLALCGIVEHLLLQSDRVPEVLPIAQESWRILGARYGPFSAHAHRSICLLARVYELLGRYHDAVALLEPVLKAYREQEGVIEAQAPHRIELLERIIKLYETWHADEPGKGYAEKAAQWRATLEATSKP